MPVYLLNARISLAWAYGACEYCHNHCPVTYIAVLRCPEDTVSCYHALLPALTLFLMLFNKNPCALGGGTEEYMLPLGISTLQGLILCVLETRESLHCHLLQTGASLLRVER